MSSLHLLASGWPRVFSTLGLGAVCILGLMTIDPDFDGMNGPEEIYALVAQLDHVPLALSISILFGLYLVGEVILFLPRSFRFFVIGNNPEDRLLTLAAKTENTLIISEFRAHSNRTELFESLGYLLILFFVFEVVLNYLSGSAINWIAACANLITGGLIVRSVSHEHQRFTRLLDRYLIGDTQ